MTKGTYVRFYAVIQQIPEGKVATYGQIAILAGLPGMARQVGYALNVYSGDDLPWHRVINAKGQISKRSDPLFEDIQRQLLEAEKIKFDEKNRVPLKIYQWNPK